MHTRSWNRRFRQPALTLVAQTVFGLMFGLFGIILATPLTAAILAAVQHLTQDDPEYR